MTVFDRKVKRIQRNRAASFENSEDFNYIRESVGQHLADRLDDLLTHKFNVALNLGAHDGYLRPHLQNTKAGIETLFQMDFADKFVEKIHQKKWQEDGMKALPIVADEEFLPFKDDSLDLVISNLSLHWVNDLPGTFIQIHRALRPDGLFLASMFGEGSLVELRNSFTLAEQERDGGVSPHISPFAGISDIGNLLTRARFSLPTVDTETIQITYKDPFALMRDLQGMGENNAAIGRRESLSKDVIMAAASIYQALYGNEDGSVPATFQIIYLIGWVPHHSQQQPKRRGSAQVSMRTIGEQSARFK